MKVLILDIDKEGDDEITNMVEAIKQKKIQKGYEVITAQVREDDIFSKNPLKGLSYDFEQMVIAAHSRYYQPDGASIAKLGPYQTEGRARHLGMYQLSDIANYLFIIIEKNQNLKEIKFYSCETAIKQNTSSFLKKNRQIEKPLNPDYENPLDESWSSFAPSKKETTRVKQINLTQEDIQKFRDELDNKGEMALSNLEHIILDINDKVYSKQNRSLFFQGLNGVGYMDAENTNKMKTFNQKNLEHLEDHDFEEKYVDSKESVDKIVLRVDMKK